MFSTQQPNNTHSANMRLEGFSSPMLSLNHINEQTGSPLSMVGLSAEMVSTTRINDQMVDSRMNNIQSDFVVNSNQFNPRSVPWESKPNLFNLSPDFFSQNQSNQPAVEMMDEDNVAQAQYSKSINNNIDSSSEISRKTF